MRFGIFDQGLEHQPLVDAQAIWRIRPVALDESVKGINSILAKPKTAANSCPLLFFFNDGVHVLRILTNVSLVVNKSMDRVMPLLYSPADRVAVVARSPR